MNTQAQQQSPAAERIAQCAADLGITIESVFIPWSQSRNKGEKQVSLNWQVTVKRNGRDVLVTDYGAGVAHCPSYKQRMTIDVDTAVRFECENGRRAHISAGGRAMDMGYKNRILPGMCDVLASLTLDSSVLDSGSFEDWAAEFGYDTDSRKAETIYRACLDIALKLRNGLGEEGLAKLREACQDY